MQSSIYEDDPKLWAAVGRIFDKMRLLYGKRFTDQWFHLASEQELKKQWCRSLSGYTLDELKHGVEALEAMPWPPTLPEFKKSCRKPIDTLVAYYEAVAGLEERNHGNMGRWSHPAVYWAAISMSFDLRRKSYSEVRIQWEAALKRELDRNNIAAIPVPFKQLLHKRSGNSKENARQFSQWAKIFFAGKKHG